MAVAACLLVAIGFTANGLLTPRRIAIPDVAAELGLKPRTVELTVERAARARHAVLNRDYVTARAIIAAELSRSKMENFGFYPFRYFMDDLSDLRDPIYGARVDAWVKADMSDTVPLLVRAQYELDIAWARRGTNYRHVTSKPDLDFFDDVIERANSDIDAALARSDANPYYYALKLRILYSLGAQQASKAVFADAIKKYPSYYSLYSIALATLQPKWGGSVQAMREFVEAYAGQAASTSPLKMLYVELYGYFITMSSEDCSSKRLSDDAIRDCVTDGARKLGAAGIEPEVVRALGLYRTSDKYQYNVKIASQIAPLIRTIGADAYAGALLQLTASATGSDTQLKEDKATHHNDYMIDDLVALSWGVKNDKADAIQKSEEALRDVVFATFPNEESKDLEYADIFEDLAGNYSKLNRYREVIAYETAALAFGGPRPYQHLICNAYVQMQSYQEAVDACTPLINGPDEIETRYWRAAAYHYLGQREKEEADLRVVADSENTHFRTSALINLSALYEFRSKFQDAIDLLDSHPFVFDEASQRKTDLAIIYNNRCAAFMYLGELQKALDDCTASLRFDSIPDAFHKQQELVRRLKAASAP